jgi:hypothetical protein
MGVGPTERVHGAWLEPAVISIDETRREDWIARRNTAGLEYVHSTSKLGTLDGRELSG